jgi:hypothetical protein
MHHRLQITDQMFKCNLTFFVDCVFSVQTDEWWVQLDSSTPFAEIKTAIVKKKR